MMFEFDKFLSDYGMSVEAINFTVTDMRTGKKERGTFYYPSLDNKSLENLCKYGYRVEEIGERTKASGKINLAGLFGRFVEEGGLE